MPADRQSARRRERARGAGVAVAFWGLGILLAFHPTLLTRFARQQGAPVDSRLNNYQLEHAYRWLASAGERELWQAGFFHPMPDTPAYGDVQLATMPVYALWRALGVSYDSAFQLWCLSVLTLNYAAFWLLLRRPIGAGYLAAAFGALLFAFGAARVNQIGHEQLFPQFYLVVALYALFRLLQPAARAAPAWIAVLVAALVSQLYSGFYFGWFCLLALSVAGVWAAVLPSARGVLTDTLRRHWRALALALALGGIAVAPLARHYLDAARAVGFRRWADVQPMLARPQSWVYLGPFNRLYGWQRALPPFRTLVADQEHRVGLGVVTTVVAGLGLYWRRDRLSTRLLVLVAASLMVCATVPMAEWLWRLIFAAVPGANAIRAVARIGMLLLIPAGIGAAYFVDALRSRRAIVMAAVAICIAEQVQTTPSFDKLAVRADVAALSERVGRECGAFLFTPLADPAAHRSGFEDGKHQLDAMWAALLKGVPTLNGLSGNFPPDWPFRRPTIDADADRARIERGLDDWSQRHAIDAARVCWIRPAVDWSWSRPTGPLRRHVASAWGLH